MIKCGIIGAGAWGTAISTIIRSQSILIWSHNKKIVNSINIKKINYYLKGIKLKNNLFATNKLEDLKNCDYFFIATPVQHTEFVLDKLSKYKIKKNFIICNKGIDIKNGNFLSTIVRNIFPKAKIAILSGPCFAFEVAKKLPTAVTFAAKDIKYFNQINKLIFQKHFRMYFSNDIIGCQIGGAIKNVYAIGAGIIDELHLGENARSAFIVRCFIEILRLGKKIGAKEKTFFGQSCLGDLLLTCSSSKSRNMSFGKQIVKNKNKNIKILIKNKKTITEGYFTSKALFKLTKKHKIDMPIAKIIYKILYLNADINEEIQSILRRPLKKEFY